MSNVGAIRAGRAFVELFADDSKLVRGLNAARRRLRTFGRTLTSAGTRVFAAGAAMTGGFALATRIFTGFDDQMRTVKAVTGSTAEQFEMLTEKAKELGRTTSFTAAQVAAGMTELGRAGFSSEEINASIGDILNLSRATGVELAEAADIAGASLRAFDLEAKDMGRVADVMTATANTSAQTISELGEAMKYAAPVASTYGLTLEETAKTLGALGNFGIKGTMAGNALKRMMLQIANPQVQETLAGMGVAVSDAGGNLRNVSAILSDVGQAMQNMGQAKRVSLLSELFGDRAIAGAAKLTGASFDRLNEAIDKASGTRRERPGRWTPGSAGRCGGSGRRSRASPWPSATPWHRPSPASPTG
jgi:TP901 family phage tail tape measure protein